MEKNWRQKLELAQALYTGVKNGKKSDAKINRAWENWANLSRDALMVAVNVDLGFGEILDWFNVIALEYKDEYFKKLKKKANNDEERMFVDILSEKGCANDMSTWSLDILSSLLERILNGTYHRFISPRNASSVISRRPDILINLSEEAIRKINGSIDDEKLPILLDCFQTTQEIYNFLKKIKNNVFLYQLFLADPEVISQWNKQIILKTNEIITKRWDSLSDQELLNVQSFQEAVLVFINSSPSWKNNSKNFKKIIDLINDDEKSYGEFLSAIVDTLGCESFYCHVVEAARIKILEQKLKSGENPKIIFDLASTLKNRTTKFQRKIIRKFLA